MTPGGAPPAINRKLQEAKQRVALSVAEHRLRYGESPPAIIRNSRICNNAQRCMWRITACGNPQITEAQKRVALCLAEHRLRFTANPAACNSMQLTLS